MHEMYNTKTKWPNPKRRSIYACVYINLFENTYICIIIMANDELQFKTVCGYGVRLLLLWAHLLNRSRWALVVCPSVVRSIVRFFYSFFHFLFCFAVCLMCCFYALFSAYNYRLNLFHFLFENNSLRKKQTNEK